MIKNRNHSCSLLAGVTRPRVPLALLIGLCSAGWAFSAAAQDAGAAAQDAPSDGTATLSAQVKSLKKRVDQLQGNVPLHIGAGVEMLYLTNDWNKDSRKQVGNAFVNKIELVINGDFDDGLFYNSRWDYQVGPQMFFPAWMYVGYHFSDHWSGKVGVINQPLGAGVDGSYYDNSYLSDVPLWLGLANNPDMGVKTTYKDNNLELVFSFMKNPESVGAKPGARFRPDEVFQGQYNYAGSTTGLALNSGQQVLANVRPVNTLGGGGAYTFHFAGDNSTQVGVNGQGGEYYNDYSHGNGGHHWAAAAFVNQKSGPFAATLQVLTYAKNLNKNPGALAPGYSQSTDSVVLSDGKLIPAKGDVYSTRVSYTVPVSLGFYKSIKYFDDYDYLNSGSHDNFTNMNTQFNIAGVELSTGHFDTWVSVLSSKNADFANGGPNDNHWNTQVNVVAGLWF